MSRRVVSIVGPEGVTLPLDVASVAERFAAFFIDQGIITLGTIALGVPLMLAGLIDADSSAALLLVSVFLLRYFYFAALEGLWHGTTFGKRAMDLRVLSVDGNPLSGEAVIARNLMRELETMVPIAAVLAPEAFIGRSPPWMTIPALAWVAVVSLLPFLTKNRSRSGDLVGGTVVVRVPRATLLSDQAASRGSLMPIVFTPAQLGIYGEHELETLAVILRDEELDRALPDDLRIIATTIARKIGYAGPEPTGNPRLFLRAFYRQQRSTLEEKLVFGRRKKDKFDPIR
jgi:uncharacterized RDD family membrane protein YckC